jgi:hypothetical protein
MGLRSTTDPNRRRVQEHAGPAMGDDTRERHRWPPSV